MKNKRKDVSDSDESQEEKYETINGKKSPQKPNSTVDDSNSESDDASDDSIGQPNSEKSSSATGNKSSRKSTSEVNTAQSTFYLEELTPDDEIYTFQCPEKYKKHILGNQNIDFNKLNTIISKKTNEMYHLDVLNSENKFITLAMPRKNSGGCFVNLPLKGHVIVQKGMAMPSFDCEDSKSDNKKSGISFPTDLKIRHPLLGVDWKEHISLVHEVLEKSHVKRKKNKKKKSRETEVVEDVKLKRKNSISENSPSKKKKKKHSL